MNSADHLNRRKIFRAVLLTTLAAFLVWGIQWATYARPPLPEALDALVSDEFVQVAQESWLTFAPAQAHAAVGFIFYPGGRINPQGYAPLMRTIAAEGYLVIIPEMPLNMAPFNANIADDIQNYYPEIKHWVIGGHSVGGTIAAQYTQKHRNKIDGLIIWASYPANNVELADLSIPVTLIYGSLDPRVNADSVAERQALLPPNSNYIQIEGGDHHQFGAYEIKPDEHFAIISQADQHRQITEATLALLSMLGNN